MTLFTHGRWPRRATMTAVLAGAVLIALVSLPAAGTAKPKAPRMVAAVMQDRDGDGRADRLRLRYSKRVRHAADRDERYPFRVAGYRVRSVAKAAGRRLALRLAEKAVADPDAHPHVRYRRTRTGRVVDRARRQAVRQTFRRTRAHGNRAGTGPGSGRPTATDRDGDGVDNARDCAPRNPAIHPGAPDPPDLRFTDANCDGIDGTVRNAIFVAPDGKDVDPGTRAEPKRQISAAVAAALAAGKDVYAAAGSYDRVEAADGRGRLRRLRAPDMGAASRSHHLHRRLPRGRLRPRRDPCRAPAAQGPGNDEPGQPAARGELLRHPRRRGRQSDPPAGHGDGAQRPAGRRR